MTASLPEKLRALGRSLGRSDRRLLYDAAQRIHTLEYQALPVALPLAPSRWGCTTFGCARGWNGTQEAMPRDWSHCPSCGGQLAAIQEAVLSEGSGVCRPVGDQSEWVNAVTGSELPEQIRRVRENAQRARVEGWHEADDVLALVSVAEGARVLNRLEVAARELDALFTGTPGRPGWWVLGGLVLTDPAAEALLTLRGYLSDLNHLRSQEPGTVEPEPAHLRDDAPVLICGRCHRETVDAEVGQPCQFPQPDGSHCPGVFEQPRYAQEVRVEDGPLRGKLREAIALLKELRVHFVEYDRERTDGLTSPIIARIETAVAAAEAELALAGSAREAVVQDLRWAIGVLEAAAPTREQDEGHPANRALVYLYAIREALGAEPS